MLSLGTLPDALLQRAIATWQESPATITPTQAAWMPCYGASTTCVGSVRMAVLHQLHPRPLPWSLLWSGLARITPPILKVRVCASSFLLLFPSSFPFFHPFKIALLLLSNWEKNHTLFYILIFFTQFPFWRLTRSCLLPYTLPSLSDTFSKQFTVPLKWICL